MSQLFDLADPISILSFISTFKTSYNTYGVCEEDEMWVFKYLFVEILKEKM